MKKLNASTMAVMLSAHRQLERLPKQHDHDMEIMGMGVAGYNTVQEYHLIKDEVLRFSPDLVILLTAVNDFERTVGTKKFVAGEKIAIISLP